MIAPDYNPVGDCADGYYGTLCASCLPGYSRTGDYGCEKCPSSKSNTLRICGVMVGMSIAIVVLVRATLSSAVKNSIHSIYNKIFLNHLQMIMITASFNLNWPS